MPEFIDEREVAAAIKEHRVVPSYGPLIRFAIDGQGVGSDVAATGGSATATVNIQAPRWMQVDRVEVYENGRMIREFVGSELDVDGVVKLDAEFVLSPTDENGLAQDAWYVVIALGEDDLAPVFTPVDIPKLELNEIVVGALGELDLGALSGAVSAEAVAVPRTFPVFPYAMTNPIWVDADEMAGFQALGSVPSWFRPTPD